jgi:hypothetical protein
MGENEPVPSGDPERALVPLAQARLAKSRQEMLATMVMLGMQRIVIESGSIHASMRFHIDTRSAAQADQGSTLDVRNQINASGSYGAGLWGVSAAISNTIGYVSTQRSQTTEEMNTDLDLNSSVDINFKTDYLPLDRMAGPGQARKIIASSRNPEAEEAKAADAARKSRADRAAASDTARRDSLDKRLTPTGPVAPPPAGAPGTIEDAEKARQRAAASERGGGTGAQTKPPAGGTVTTTPGGTATAPPGGTAVTPPGGTATAPPAGTAVTPPGGTATAPPAGTAVTPPGGTATAPPSFSGGQNRPNP